MTIILIMIMIMIMIIIMTIILNMILILIGNSIIGSTHSFHSIPLRSMIIGYSMLTLFVPNPAPPFSGHWLI